MKISKSLAFIFVSLLLFPTGGKGMDESAAFSAAQRNLSTPKSRLVGHWAGEAGAHIYFGPIDASTNEGTQIQVFPDEDKYLEKLRQKSRQILIDMDETVKKLTDELLVKKAHECGGKAFPTTYRILSYEPAGTKIAIETDTSAIEEKNFPTQKFRLIGPYILVIDMDGKTMRTDQLAMLEYIRRDAKEKKYSEDTIAIAEQSVLNIGVTIFLYIDAKTSPEGD